MTRLSLEIPPDLAQSIRGCTSWRDVQAKWQYFHVKQKGDLFEEFVKAYLQAVPIIYRLLDSCLPKYNSIP